ncbi:MAG: Glycine betaine methyltransferase [Deltaproteobacteria bacterium]|jgi:trimethylamine--corrinoid protein Co-methyltransferase|nr:Glycine betaine methyltransferase [Deltaproteobacteria bacterium]
MPDRKKRGGGRAARQALRSAPVTKGVPFITRNVPCYEVLNEEGLSLIENNAETILQEIGVEFRGDQEALDLWKDAGADIDGERVRIPKGLCKKLVQDSAPPEFIQHARNPERSVRIGGKHTVLVPSYGSPFVRDLEKGRRYATLEDFQNFVKLAYSTPYLHHSGGTICEPVDLPVNKRHLDMVYSHMRFSDKPFMGSVTAPERAQDTVDMSKLLFGEEYLQENTVIVSLINANSPLVWDQTMLGALKVYASNNQACLISPFCISGAMSPVTIAATSAQLYAEALSGMAFAQLVRPGAPVIFGNFSSSMSMQSGAPTFGTPEPQLVLYVVAALARRLGVPFRSGGGLNSAKIADSQAAYEAANTLQHAMLAGVNFMLHTAGWLEGGLVMGYEKFIMDVDQAGMIHNFLEGVDLSENGQGLEALREIGPGQHFLDCDHTRENFEQAFFRSSVADNNSFEQWEADGSMDTSQRANLLWKKMLDEYEMPPMDPAVDEALREFVRKRKESFPDSNY